MVRLAKSDLEHAHFATNIQRHPAHIVAVLRNTRRLQTCRPRSNLSSRFSKRSDLSIERTPRVRVEGDQLVTYQCDGGWFEGRLPFDIEVSERRLRVLMPAAGGGPGSEITV